MTHEPEREMTCKELVELVTEYLDESLPAIDRERFDAHLATCPFCTLYLEQMRDTIRTMGQLPKAAVSPAALETLLAHFRRWR
jgi:anti-sigma factor RsiW